MDKWFIYINEEIQGPFKTDELKAQVSHEKYTHEAYIWGNNQKQWLKPETWLQAVDEISKTITPKKAEDQRRWHYAYEDSSYGPFSEDKLLEELKKLNNVDGILLWSKGMKKWESIFEFHNFVDALGCTRRAHPRANIDGSVIINFENQVSIGNLKTISVGGLGATNLSNELRRGQEVRVEIKSPHFYEPISAVATIQYVNKEGFIGMKFSQIHMESQSKIIQYIKKQEEARFNEAA